MKVTLAALLAVAVGLAGCTKTGTAANGRHSWTKPGVLRIAVSEEPKTLNALLSANTVEGFISRFMFEPLISADARGTRCRSWRPTFQARPTAASAPTG